MSDDGSSELASPEAETNAPLPSVENSDSAVPPPSGPFGTDPERDAGTDQSQAPEAVMTTYWHRDSVEIHCVGLRLTWAKGQRQAGYISDDGNSADDTQDKLTSVRRHLALYDRVVHPDTVAALGPDAPEGGEQAIEMLTKWLTEDSGGDEDDEYPALKRHNEDIKSAVNQYLLAKLNPNTTTASLDIS